ncbi:MAG: carboxymuconolactone decarboxylase family protein [Pseudomonadales bacterium]|jgi:alkylhydroperoxidase family enzyme
MRHVLEPLEPPFPDPVARILERYPQDGSGYILSLFRVFARSLRFLGGKGAINLLDRDSPISLRERELVILRVTANLECEYEWGVHVSAFARAAGLTDGEVAATRLGTPDTGSWTPSERCLLRCVDDLCCRARIEDDSYAEFQQIWNLEQQLEIMALVGNYHLISFVANTTRLPPEDAAARFP